jgi:hypothetical protein
LTDRVLADIPNVKDPLQRRTHLKQTEGVRTVASLRVWEETRRKARLLAAIQNIGLAEAVDAAVTAGLEREEQKGE